MIQRIQTIYFLLAALCASSVFFITVYTVTLTPAGGLVPFMTLHYNLNIEDLLHSLQCAVWMVTILLPLAAILLYKNRRKQILLGRIALLITGIALALLALEYDDIAMKAPGNEAEIVPGPGLFIPIATFIFLILAIRAVKKDEALVRSADRIR